VADEVVGFYRRDAARVVAGVKAIESLQRGGIPPRGVASTSWGGLVPYKAPAGGISAGGSATCTRQKDNGSGGLTNDTDTATVWNNYTSAVAANALVWATWYDGRWRVVGANC
jgi:hypothetical protein